MEKKSNKKKILRVILYLVISIVIWGVGSYISYNIILKDDIALKQKYEERERNCKILRDIADECIIEGEGIDIDKIIKYEANFEIMPIDDNIVLNYYIITEEYYVRYKEYSYKAKITLSKDLKIINKEYGIESISFEEYEKQYKFDTKIHSLVISGIIVYVCMFIYFLWPLVYRPRIRRK